MRALLQKEWRQGYLLLMFSLLMAVMLPVLYAIILATYMQKYPGWFNDFNYFFGILYVIVMYIMAAITPAGMIASELERGTMPVLLGLPLTRRRIWGAKLFAAFSISVIASGLLFVTGTIVLPQALEQPGFLSHLPKMLVAWLVVFSVAFLCSSLSQRLISALLGTIIFFAVIYLLEFFWIVILGANLTGEAWTDVTLWALAACPGLLAGSYAAFNFGGLLQSRRKWWLGLPVAAAGALIVALIVIGVMRWELRYVRSKVTSVSYLSCSEDGTTVALQANSKPAPIRSWGSGPYMSQYLVFVDTQTGRELLRKRGTGGAWISLDGRYAASLHSLGALTWSAYGESPLGQYLEIWDLGKCQVLYNGLVPMISEFSQQRYHDISWSPNNECIALTGSYQTETDSQENVLFMSRDAKILRVISNDNTRMPGLRWKWASGKAIYQLDTVGRLYRIDLEKGSKTEIWRVPSTLIPENYVIWNAQFLVSPDKQHIAIYTDYWLSPESRDYRSARDRIYLAFVLSADGSQSHLIYQVTLQQRYGMGARLAWASSSKWLALAVSYGKQQELPVVKEFVVWREGATKAAITTLALARPINELIPFNNDLAILSYVGGISRKEERSIFLIDVNGKVHPFPYPHLKQAFENQFLLCWNEKQAILTEKKDQKAIYRLDLTSGKQTRIYP